MGPANGPNPRSVYNLLGSMFPLLPALILLLLNGPASIERLAADGRLPAALASVQARAEQTKSLSRADELALASLLTLDGSTADALFRLLASDSLIGEEPARALIDLEVEQTPPAVPPELGDPQDGQGTSRNSRDGPLVR